MATIGKRWAGILALTCIVLLVGGVLCLPTCATQVPAASVRDPRWAQPLDRPGLPNLHKVSDELYRGAQPTAEGFRQLKEMGVRTDVNLRSFNSDRDELGDVDLQYEHITMKAWHAEDKEVVRFLHIVTDPEKRPVFVHCQHGADRTGVMSAVYRMAVQGWTADDAVEEMIRGGYGFHEIWREDLTGYLRGLDLDRIKREAGMAGATAGEEPTPRRE